MQVLCADVHGVHRSSPAPAGAPAVCAVLGLAGGDLMVDVGQREAPLRAVGQPHCVCVLARCVITSEAGHCAAALASAVEAGAAAALRRSPRGRTQAYSHSHLVTQRRCIPRNRCSAAPSLITRVALSAQSYVICQSYQQRHCLHDRGRSHSGVGSCSCLRLVNRRGSSNLQARQEERVLAACWCS